MFRCFKVLFFSLLCLFMFAVGLGNVKAQPTDTDQNPPGMKWREINTDNFQVIYPQVFEVEAQRVVNTLQRLLPEVSRSLNNSPRKISIILQNQGVISNGFVTLAPRRSEFFTTPAQEFDSQDWLNSLSVHELRHIVQFDKLGGKFSDVKILESLISAIFNIQIPSWFWEGDAVGIETALTTTGRGRLPSFELAFRTNTLNGTRYSYVKNYLGSIKNITPGYYPLGYFLTTKLRRDFGPGVLDRIMSRVKNNPFRFYNLNNTVKKYTNLNIRQLHDSTVTELNRLWQIQREQTKPLTYTAINKRHDQTPTDYLLPVAISDTQILVLKQSRKYAPALVIVNQDGTEEKVLSIGTQTLSNFNYQAGKMVWDEQRADMRFQKRSYSVINIYDLTSKQYHQLTHRSKLFAPALSPDGKRVVAVRVSPSNVINLVELDAQTGQEIKKYSNPYSGNLQTPQFNASGDKIVCTIVGKQGVGLLEFDCKSGVPSRVISSQKQQITHPTYAGRTILFKAHYNGLDNIYRIDPADGKVFQLGSVEYGAFNPSYDRWRDRILFNNYQPYGLDVASMPYDSKQGTPVSSLKNTFIDYAQPLVIQEGSKDVFNDIPTTKHASKPYSEIAHSYYFYNMQPVLPSMDEIETGTIGFTLLSNNKMNTLGINLGYYYNQQLKANEYAVGVTYKRLYPLLNFSYRNSKLLSFDLASTPFAWREHYSRFQVEVPFLLSRRNWTYSFGLTTATSITDRYELSSLPANFATQLNLPLEHQVYFTRSALKSSMDLAPRWLQGVTLGYRNFPFNNNQTGHLFSLRTTLLTPGIMPNHSFGARFNYQQTVGDYRGTNDIPMVSGYANLAPTSLFDNTFLLSYQFPVAHPDWEIGPLAYVKRLRAGFFSDFENIGYPGSLMPRSYGFSLAADMNLLRFDFLTAGPALKVIFAPERSLFNPIFEVGFNINY